LPDADERETDACCERLDADERETDACCERSDADVPELDACETWSDACCERPADDGPEPCDDDSLRHDDGAQGSVACGEQWSDDDSRTVS